MSCNSHWDLYKINSIRNTITHWIPNYNFWSSGFICSVFAIKAMEYFVRCTDHATESFIVLIFFRCVCGRIFGGRIPHSKAIVPINQPHFSVSLSPCTCQFRALHMKEHPDYKYRPRRKPKTLVKSPGPQNHHNHNNHHTHNHHHHHQQQQQQQSNKDQQTASAVAVSAQQHLSTKYPFTSSLELTLGIQPRSTTFPLAAHYPLTASPLDTTLALDLQARLQQMYAGSLYPPWRYFGCPPSALMSQDPQSPPSPVAYVCVKPTKRTPSPVTVSNQNTSASPPSVIWPTPLRFSAEHTV